MNALNQKKYMNFKEVPLETFSGGVPDEIRKVWKSKLFVVRYYQYDTGNGLMERLTIDYVVHELNENIDAIRWDTLQDIKNSVGFKDRWAVEVFPPEEDEVSGISHRHLWLIDSPNFHLTGGEQ